MSDTPIRRNPSRKECEDIIRRILITEVLEHGSNHHFKNASDFMNYFESLYPASDSLTKQVQRAVKAIGMPKDSNGYYIINKTEEQLDQDKELSFLLQKTQAVPEDLSEYETLFLQTASPYKDYLLQLIEESATFSDKYITIVNSSQGLLFYTRSASQLKILIASLKEARTL